MEGDWLKGGETGQGMSHLIARMSLLVGLELTKELKACEQYAKEHFGGKV